MVARARQNSTDKAQRLRDQRRKNSIDEAKQTRLRCNRDFSLAVTAGLDDFTRSPFGGDGQRWRSVGNREQGVFFFVLSFKQGVQMRDGAHQSGANRSYVDA